MGQNRTSKIGSQPESISYTQIAERLAAHFDYIYYVSCENSNYAEFSIKRRTGQLEVNEEGKNFFESSSKSIDRLIYPEDRERLRSFLDRDHLISELENARQLTADYRMLVNGDKIQFTRMTVTYSSDRSHFIICIENRDASVRREQEHLAALALANQMARRDELTHVKNKTAYHETETELQRQIKEGNVEFGIVICDLNDLKAVNDSEGHRAGDEYIKAACALICRVFQHSPVFRIGGDEFAVILRGEDYRNRKRLMSRLGRNVEENIRMGEGPVLASGLAEYQPERERTVGEVFNRADSAMYENKAYLREQKVLWENRSLKENANIRVISEERRIKLDALYRAFAVVAEGTYVYICDMQYDYSRWSKTAVDAFGLPSEYMYGAGDIWERHIHPEDREAYRKGIAAIFTGNEAEHDMQYRALRTNGNYDVCTCRGVVIRDMSGEPAYFAGTIRNHSLQGHMDALTGLRNQYGFFEDLDSCIRRNVSISVILLSISRFSEINEIYGYHFGNRVLQDYARLIYDTTGNTGHSYRIDGTKFAVISNTLTLEEMRDRYNGFRRYLHESFAVDGRRILLEPNCGALRVDSFEISSQTIYACLNFACEESKYRRMGDLVEFRDEVNAEKHQLLEMLHEIRGSIKRGFRGFYLLYQPVVNVNTERMIAAEALLRWKSDRFGEVLPDQFIPVLESDPLFPELGEWIIRESLLTALQVMQVHPDFVIHVNLSYTQLEKPGFVNSVLHLLDELNFPPEHLCLEITERCRLIDMELLKNTAAGLKSRGVQLAMDDYGTGFSSVGIMREIPFDVIKVDRSLVTNIEESETDRQLVGTVVQLASICRAKVCVEGIETAGMRDILRNFHVSSFQGYFYAKPLQPENLLERGGES